MSEGPRNDALVAHLTQWRAYLTQLTGRAARALDLDAEELRADVVARVVRKFHTFDPARGGFSTWLTPVAKSVVCAAYARRRRTVRVAPRPLLRGPEELPPGRDLDGLNALPDPRAIDPTAGAAASDLRAAVTTALAHLSADERETVATAFWTDGVRLTRVGRGHLRTALARLREHLPNPNA